MGNRPSRILLAALLIAAGAEAAAAVAALPQFTVCGAAGGCGTVRAIDDEQLAVVAGKFTVAGEVVGMSLTMTSSWQSANGQRLEAAAGVSISLPGSGRAGASFHAQARGSAAAAGDSTAPGSRVVHAGQGIDTVTGVAQAIQVAGDGNGAANVARVNVTDEPLAAGARNGQRQASYQAANGARAEVRIGGDRVSMHLSTPNDGSSFQRINIGGAGNIQQGIQVASDGQKVVNELQLQLQMQQFSRAGVTSQGLARSLDMLRGR